MRYKANSFRHKGNIAMKMCYGWATTIVMSALAGINILGCNTIADSGRGMNANAQGIQNASEDAAKKVERAGTHTITASSKRGGSISPSGSTSVPRGSSQTFIATANAGYRVTDVFVDGRSVGAPTDLFHDDSSSYTFKNVVDNHVISATFDMNTHR